MPNLDSARLRVFFLHYAPLRRRIQRILSPALSRGLIFLIRRLCLAPTKRAPFYARGRSRSRSRATSVTLWTTRRIKDATFPVRVAFKKSLSRVQRAARLIKCKDQARVVADFTDAVAGKRINRSCDTCIVEISTRCNETLRRITDPSTRSERSCARARDLNRDLNLKLNDPCRYRVHLAFAFYICALLRSKQLEDTRLDFISNNEFALAALPSLKAPRYSLPSTTPADDEVREFSRSSPATCDHFAQIKAYRPGGGGGSRETFAEKENGN